MLLIINMLDIQHYKICHLHKFLEFTEEWLFSCKWIPAGIQCRVDSSFFGFLEQLQQKIDLQKRFASTDGNTALTSPVSAVFPGFINQFICCVESP